MSQISPVALLVALVLNALSLTFTVGDQRPPTIYAEVLYRGDPGPAEVESFEAAGFDHVPIVEPVSRAPSPTMVTPTFGPPGPAVEGRQEGAFPRPADCTSEVRWSPTRPATALDLAQLLEQGHNEKTCKADRHSVGVSPAEQEVAQQNQTQFARHGDRVHTNRIPAGPRPKSVRMSRG